MHTSPAGELTQLGAHVGCYILHSRSGSFAAKPPSVLSKCMLEYHLTEYYQQHGTPCVSQAEISFAGFTLPVYSTPLRSLVTDWLHCISAVLSCRLSAHCCNGQAAAHKPAGGSGAALCRT